MDYYKANVSFSGIISMHEGEIRCITSKKLIKDLTKAGYIRKLNKKEIEAMKVLGLINEEEAIEEDEGLDGDFDESQDENLEEKQNDGQDDKKNSGESQETEEPNGSDEDVVIDEN